MNGRVGGDARGWAVLNYVLHANPIRSDIIFSSRWGRVAAPVGAGRLPLRR